jgi:thiol-disulfide isomerase/thioredoxin
VTHALVAISPAFLASYVVLWFLVVILSILVFLVYRHFGLEAMGTFAGVQRDGLALGEEAPLIRGFTADAETVALFPGQTSPTLLLFVAPDCQPCGAVLPFVEELNRFGSTNGLEIVAVAAGSSAAVERLRETHDPSYISLAEGENHLFDDYLVRVTPFGFVIDDRRVRAKGLCSDPVLLRDLLAQGDQDAAATVVDRLIREGLDGPQQHRSGQVLEGRPA